MVSRNDIPLIQLRHSKASFLKGIVYIGCLFLLYLEEILLFDVEGLKFIELGIC